jgi:CheY-like chemotaxis protein
MDSYKDYLDLKMRPHGYDVKFITNIDDAFDLLDKRNDIDLVILDIMMPWGTQLTAERTNGGLLTGVVFYEHLRSKFPAVPVLVFTNRTDEDLEKKLETDPHCRFRQKTDWLLDDFVKEVAALLALEVM